MEDQHEPLLKVDGRSLIKVDDSSGKGGNVQFMIAHGSREPIIGSCVDAKGENAVFRCLDGSIYVVSLKDKTTLSAFRGVDVTKKVTERMKVISPTLAVSISSSEVNETEKKSGTEVKEGREQSGQEVKGEEKEEKEKEKEKEEEGRDEQRKEPIRRSGSEETEKEHQLEDGCPSKTIAMMMNYVITCGFGEKIDIYTLKKADEDGFALPVCVHLRSYTLPSECVVACPANDCFYVGASDGKVVRFQLLKGSDGSYSWKTILVLSRPSKIVDICLSDDGSLMSVCCSHWAAIFDMETQANKLAISIDNTLVGTAMWKSDIVAFSCKKNGEILLCFPEKGKSGWKGRRWTHNAENIVTGIVSMDMEDKPFFAQSFSDGHCLVYEVLKRDDVQFAPNKCLGRQCHGDRITSMSSVPNDPSTIVMTSWDGEGTVFKLTPGNQLWTLTFRENIQSAMIRGDVIIVVKDETAVAVKHDGTYLRIMEESKEGDRLWQNGEIVSSSYSSFPGGADDPWLSAQRPHPRGMIATPFAPLPAGNVDAIESIAVDKLLQVQMPDEKFSGTPATDLEDFSSMLDLDCAFDRRGWDDLLDAKVCATLPTSVFVRGFWKLCVFLNAMDDWEIEATSLPSSSTNTHNSKGLWEEVQREFSVMSSILVDEKRTRVAVYVPRSFCASRFLTGVPDESSNIVLSQNTYGKLDEFLRILEESGGMEHRGAVVEHLKTIRKGIPRKWERANKYVRHILHEHEFWNKAAFQSPPYGGALLSASILQQYVLPPILKFSINSRTVKRMHHIQLPRSVDFQKRLYEDVRCGLEDGMTTNLKDVCNGLEMLTKGVSCDPAVVISGFKCLHLSAVEKFDDADAWIGNPNESNHHVFAIDPSVFSPLLHSKENGVAIDPYVLCHYYIVMKKVTKCQFGGKAVILIDDDPFVGWAIDSEKCIEECRKMSQDAGIVVCPEHVMLLDGKLWMRCPANLLVVKPSRDRILPATIIEFN
eukprot:TRINITY_DN1271_c0_g1_i1.p1 TRINITY_DN1271_c0_g1~~TRINITY_DN1271_c0_g1_i1.p1  ORF type:complete len:987 (-),score=252.56 TRINITY_DN1271_c0_g1_i1:42-3002(-)